MQEKKKIKILYKNYRGETTLREIVPIEIIFGSTEFHPEKQWLLKAYALEKNEERTFAMKDILEWHFDDAKMFH